MNKDEKIIDMLTPKHLKCTFELRKPQPKKPVKLYLRAIGTAAIFALAIIIVTKALQPNEIKAMPSPNEVLMYAIEKTRKLKSMNFEFDARITLASPDHAEGSPWAAVSKCRYRALILNKDEVIQRIDFDFDSIQVNNIYHNDSVFMWKDGELLYKGTKETPDGIKGLIKAEDVLRKFCETEGLQIVENDTATTIRQLSAQDTGSVLFEGTFDKKSGLVLSCRTAFIYEDTEFPIFESTKMEYNVPVTKEELLKTPTTH